jgi:hypothetical protein
MSQRVQIYVLVGLLALAAFLFFRSRGSVSGVAAAHAANGKFTPLNVKEPDLRLDLLEQIRKAEYKGLHRDIFSGRPLPPPTPKMNDVVNRSGPVAPSGPPPVQLPAQFFGYANPQGSSNRVAFFLNGDNVLVVGEGDTFLGNFRLIHIGNASADVEEISSGRHASVPLELPPDEGLNQ